MKNSPRLMFFFGIFAFAVVTIIVHQGKFVPGEFGYWVFRVLIALAAASISISIPGMVEINYTKDSNGMMRTIKDDSGNAKPTNLAEKEPVITASGAIAIFVLVYLFDPITL